MVYRTFSFCVFVPASVSENAKTEKKNIFGYGNLCAARTSFRDLIKTQQTIHGSKPTNR